MDANEVLTIAKAEIGDRKRRARSFIEGLLGARVTIALCALFALAYGSHLHFAPHRLPPVGLFGPTELGLWPPPEPTTSELGRKVDEQLGQVGAAAQRQARAAACGDENAAANAIACWLSAHPEVKPHLNLAGLIASIFGLVVTIWFQARMFRRLKRLG